MKKLIFIIVLLISSLSCYGSGDVKREEKVNQISLPQIEDTVQNETKYVQLQEEVLNANEIKMEQEKQENTEILGENILTKNEKNDKHNIKQETTEQPKIEIISQEIQRESNKPKEETQTQKKVEQTSTQPIKQTEEIKTNQEEIKDNTPKCNHGNQKFYNTKAEAIATYDSELHKWSEKWTNYEIDDETYHKNCPTGYEIMSCPFCEKWTINIYYN